ncbi:hypothetical protein Nepgr_026125 [Nepenthes gracilis]|uniref:DUF7865 domain-containing protein n=1 Tax=Nepenthes gracilis TaxID=150966 RepID=A0AAD3Y042_NEPGR|nr:hypothetical protein Nepgr_026125 [Nepenthes gracilis]
MGSYAFPVICLLHSLIALICGAMMMFYTKEVYMFVHGNETATKLQGSTPLDELLLRTSDSFSGLLLCGIGFFLFMISFVRETKFQNFFAKGCVLLHLSVAVWRIYFERNLDELAHDLAPQVIGDVIMAISWVFFLVYSWREKYD